MTTVLKKLTWILHCPECDFKLETEDLDKAMNLCTAHCRQTSHGIGIDVKEEEEE